VLSSALLELLCKVSNFYSPYKINIPFLSLYAFFYIIKHKIRQNYSIMSIKNRNFALRKEGEQD